MVVQKEVEQSIVGNYTEMELDRKEQDGLNDDSFKGQVKKLFWHGGSAYDAWFSCASNQVFLVSILFGNSWALRER